MNSIELYLNNTPGKTHSVVSLAIMFNMTDEEMYIELEDIDGADIDYDQGTVTY